MKVTKLGGKSYILTYTYPTLLFPRWESRFMRSFMRSFKSWKKPHTLFYLKEIESKYPHTSGGSNSTLSSFPDIEPETALFVCTVTCKTYPWDLWEHLRYFSEQRPPAPLSPPTSVRVHQLLDKFLALFFLTFYPCTQAPVEILSQVNLGRLKPCSSPDKPKEKWK